MSSSLQILLLILLAFAVAVLGFAAATAIMV
jgi:hypothetical protein